MGKTQVDLFDKPKTATDLLCDLIRYKDGRMTREQIAARWKGQQWSTQGLRDWARWVWKESVK